MIKPRYILLSIAACAIVTLSSCVGGTPSADNSPASVANSAPQATEATSTTAHSGHGKKVNINDAILSELDKFEGMLISHIVKLFIN